MKEEFPSTISIDNHTLNLVVERKRVKNINARLSQNVLRVSIPQQVSRAYVESVLPALAQRLIRRQHARQINEADQALTLAQQIARRFPQPLAVVDVKFTTTQTTCWGSYSPRTRTIRLNAVLRLMPPWVLEAVMAHELAHAVHADHSPAFWALVREICPHTDRARAFLEGVSWLAQSWEYLPSVERTQLTGSASANQGETP